MLQLLRAAVMLGVVHTSLTLVLLFSVDLLRRKVQSSLSKQYVDMSQIAAILILAIELPKLFGVGVWVLI
jgi:hypothetical protein